jgi:pimeloyl-ACP methyl ester carboxylesterase
MNGWITRLVVALAVVAVGLAQSGLAQTPARAAPAPTAFAGARFLQASGSGGVPLNVVEKGDPSRPAVLFIHGFRQSYLSWAEQFGSTLAEHCHLVAFDLRGHGNSGQPWEASAYDTSRPWADDVEAVIKATGLSKPLIVAWSFGGNVVMDFARHYPNEPVAGFVLTGTGAGTSPMPAPPPNAPPRPTTSPDLETNIKAVDASINLLFAANLDPALRARFAAAAMRVSPFVDRAIAARGTPTNADLAPTIRTPVTLIVGGKDPIVPPAFTARLKALIPDARVIEFADAGHAPFLDDPGRFNAILDELQCSK